MKYGINTLLWMVGFDESHLGLLPRIKEMGFDGVEVARFSFQDCPALPIRRAIEANGLEAVCCSALTGRQSLANENAGESLAFLKEAIRWTGELGAKILAGPFCSAVGYLPGRRRTAEEWKRVIEGLQALTPTLEETGVTLAIEPLNRFETFFLNTAADARALCDQVNHPQIGVLFDTFHANIEEKSVAAALEQVGPHLKHVHTCENDRGTPGTGHVRWTEVFEALAKLKYNEWLVIESFGPAIPEIAAAACIWRDLAPSTESIAADGVRFLKRQRVVSDPILCAPILCANVLRKVDAKLLELLASLRPEEWDLPTVAPAWTVRDVAAHLLDTPLRKLSLARDGWFVEKASIQSPADVAALVNRLNREGVAVYRRLSPPVLLAWMTWACDESAAFHEGLDPFARAAFPVSWAGQDGSPNWFDTARELTERWHHQQQIREATNRPGIMTRELYYPVLDCFARGLPYAYRNVEAAVGTLVRVEVVGACGGAWLLRKEAAGWLLEPAGREAPDARIGIPEEIAWRVFTKGIRREAALERVCIEGDRRLALGALELTAIVA